VRKRINDIRIKARGREGEASRPALRRAESEIYSLNSENNVIDRNFYQVEEKNDVLVGDNIDFLEENSRENLEELISKSRRNFLKILIASGGVLLAGSFLNKINKFKDMPLVGQSIPNSNTIAISSLSGDRQINNDYESFFENFRLVKNKKEYILYNKYGDNILTIERDV